MSGCKELTEEAFVGFNSDEPKDIQTLNLSWCHTTDQSLAWIIHGCPYLTNLDLSLNLSLTSAGVAKLNQCVNLKQLHLNRNSQLKDEAFTFYTVK